MRRLYSSLKCSPSVELQSAISTGGEHLCGWCVSDVGPGPPIQCWGSKRVFARAGSRGESVSYGSACLCLRGHHRSYPFGSIHFFSKGWDFTRAAEPDRIVRVSIVTDFSRASPNFGEHQIKRLHFPDLVRLLQTCEWGRTRDGFWSLDENKPVTLVAQWSYL